MSDGAQRPKFDVFDDERRAKGSAAAAKTMSNPNRVDHPATSEKGYTDDEAEFIRAVADYQARTGHKFPSFSELYRVMVALGYSRTEAPRHDDR